jgi:predicted O-methyltransferase YrrM
MFELMDEKIKNRMKYLEDIDQVDRNDDTPRMERLRQIPPETGKFITLIASNCPEGEFIEIGTSAGYSTLWLSLLALERKIKIKTFEILPAKIQLAKETFRKAGIEDSVELIEGDALNYLDKLERISFCFLDAEKEIYESCWDIVSGKIISGGILIADNAINHRETIQPMIDKSLNDNRYDSMIVPIGKGELVCRKR